VNEPRFAEHDLNLSTRVNSLTKPIVVCFALKEEAAPFRKIAAGKPGVFTLITGIGRQNAAKSMRGILAATSPQLVLTCGFAGGLNPDLKIGDVLFELAGPAANDEKLTSGLAAAGVKRAKFFCADRIATTVAEKSKLRDETGADAVEMESAAIHAVCAERGVPCATVRVISDTAHEDLPLDFNALAKPDKNLSYGKLFLAIAKSPGVIAALMELQKKTKFAAERLAEVLAKVVSG
jgi:adenosylhomocysteine nucleosidase